MSKQAAAIASACSKQEENISEYPLHHAVSEWHAHLGYSFFAYATRRSSTPTRENAAVLKFMKPGVISNDVRSCDTNAWTTLQEDSDGQDDVENGYDGLADLTAVGVWELEYVVWYSRPCCCQHHDQPRQTVSTLDNSPLERAIIITSTYFMLALRQRAQRRCETGCCDGIEQDRKGG